MFITAGLFEVVTVAISLTLMRSNLLLEFVITELQCLLQSNMSIIAALFKAVTVAISLTPKGSNLLQAFVITVLQVTVAVGRVIYC